MMRCFPNDTWNKNWRKKGEKGESLEIRMKINKTKNWNLYLKVAELMFACSPHGWVNISTHMCLSGC